MPIDQNTSPTPVSAMAAPAGTKPSLWRTLLGGALMGVGFALNKDAAEAVMNQPMREMAMRKGQAEIGATEAQTQHTQAETAKTQAQMPLIQDERVRLQAQAAESLMHKLALEKQIQMLPAEEQRKTVATWAQAMHALSQAGMQAVVEIEDSLDARTAFLHSRGGNVTDYTFGPSMTPGKITVYRPDPSKVLSQENSDKLKALGIKVPAGVPLDTADKLIVGTLNQQTQVRVAQIHAAAQKNDLVAVHTIDAKGNPVTKFVPKQAGAEYSAAPTADMQNKAAARAMIVPAINQLEALGNRVITEKTAAVQKAKSAKRSVEAALENDPDYRVYQDARAALAGNLAVAQQGSRPSDADIKQIWLPLVPDVFKDTVDSARMKWELIRINSGLSPASGAGQTNSPAQPNPLDKFWRQQ